MLYSFTASTCTIVVVAYLLKRGPILAYLAGGKTPLRASLQMGLFFGLVGLLELYFAKERAPYDTYTLIVTFAALRCGGTVGLITAGLMTVGAPLFFQQGALGRVVLSVFFCLLVGLVVRRVVRLSRGPKQAVAPGVVIAAGVISIALAETNTVLLRFWISGAESAPFSLPIALLSVAANAVGFVLLNMILNDELVRQAAEQFRQDAEQSRLLAEHSHTLLVEAELSALRARIHPHFLFNALTSIAALCRLAPDRAEAATVQLGQIMRRALESPKRATQPLAEEAEYVTAYVEIEKLRLGTRLRFDWNIAPEAKSAQVPPFVLQTLVENSILHGIAPKLGAGSVRVTARVRRGGQILVVVADDGVGLSLDARRPPPQAAEEPAATPRRQGHGLSLCSEQLCLLYGNRARLRLLTKRDTGTLAAFCLPATAILPLMVRRQPESMATESGINSL